jgi:hypothetical protein
MISRETGQLELLESAELPPRTLVAPLQLVREIRATLGQLDIDICIGTGDAVFASSDLFEAFQAWDEEQSGESSWLN